MMKTIFIMPNKSTNPDATLMIVVDEVTPETNPKTYQYVYVGNINNLPSDVLTESNIVDIPGTNQESVMSQKGATDLISEYNVGANNSNAEYTFAQAVALVPVSLQKGGLTIKYIDSTTHEYAIKRLMSSTWNTTESNWQGIDDEPTAESENLVKSGGVKENIGNIKYYKILSSYSASDVERLISYENGILDFYIDAEKFGTNITTIQAKCYSTSLLIYINGTKVISKDFSTIDNNTIVNIVYNSVVIGYIIFKDKQKFLNYSYGGSNMDMYVNYITNPHIHLYATLIKNIVDFDNLKNGLVVNDLTTNDATKLLSAAQGKVISDATMEFIDGVNILDPSTIVSQEYMKRTNGKPTTAPDYKHTDFIELPEGGLICNSCVNNGGSYGCGCCGYAADKTTFLGYAATGTNGAPLFVDKSLTVHSDWVYVIFNIYPNDNDEYMVCKGNTLPSEYVPYVAPYWSKKALSDGEVTTSKIVDGAVTPQKSSFFNYTIGKNKCNPNDPNFLLNKQIRYSNGTVLDAGSEKCGCTGFIPVSQSGLIINYPRVDYGSYSGMAVYDSNGIYIRGARTGTYVYQQNLVGGVLTDNEAFVRFTFNYAKRNEIQVEEGNTVTTYEPYIGYRIKEQYIPFEKDNPDSINITLPDKIYAVRGDTLQVFYQGIVVAINPEVYNIQVECAVGRSLYRYWEYIVPENATLASHLWTIIVSKQNGVEIARKSCQLIIVDKAQSPQVAKNILCIGDSLTSGGKWPAEMKRRLVGTINTGTPAALGLSNINFIGHVEKTYEGTTVNVEGHMGYSWVDYVLGRQPRFRFYLSSTSYTPQKEDIYTNNGNQYTVVEVNEIDNILTILTSTSSLENTPESSGTLNLSSGTGSATMTYTRYSTESENPFWDGSQNKLSFTNYVENVCELPVGTNIDYAYILMTWNAVPEPLDTTGWANFMNNAKTFVDALHKDYPSCKIKLMGVEFIYPPTFIAATSQQNNLRYLRVVEKMNYEYQNWANSTELSGDSDDAYNTFMEFVNVSSQFDSKYNMTSVAKNANLRNSTDKEYYTNNSIHPETAGYMQIADIAYRNICNEL